MEKFKPISELNPKEKFIKISIPLTKSSGKIRVKQRNKFCEYGVPVATRKNNITANCYVEWQIGYDVVIDDDKKETTLTDRTFISSNGKTKNLFELSECIKYFYDWGIISKDELLGIRKYLSDMDEKCYLDARNSLAINRTEPYETEINDFAFLYSKVEYPVLVYNFKNHKIMLEIQIKEKQKAIGTQPMLYVCIDISELDNSNLILNRAAIAKEFATFTFNKENKDILLVMLKIFGTLSDRHNIDVISIIDLILNWGNI